MRWARSTDGVVVAVHDLGGPTTDRGSAPVLLLAHANGCHGLVFGPIARAGLSDRFDCVAPDLRGHGDTSTPDGFEFDDWRGFGDDVAAVIDELRGSGPARPIFGVGHSLGGASLLLAEAARPGSFAGLFLFEPIVPPPENDPPPDAQLRNQMADSAERRREVFPSWDAAIANFASKPPLDVLHPEALRAYVEGGFAPQPDGTVRIKCRGAVEAAVYRSSVRNGAYDRLSDVRCPVTVAVGASAPGPAEWAPAVTAALPQGRLRRFDQVGHFGPLEDPGLIAAAVLEDLAPA
jgi:pimeloyl-ACP methyl ester carboxylesterase